MESMDIPCNIYLRIFDINDHLTLHEPIAILKMEPV